MDRLGVLEKVRRAGFQEKYGAYFWNETTGGIRPVVFADAIDSAQPMAYQVKRADFDNLLLEHSIEKGAEVRQETTVLEVLFEKGRAVGVAAAGPDGVRYELRASVVVDASGQDAFLSRKMKMRFLRPEAKRAGLFAHFENVPRPEGRTAGDILLPVEDDVWYWIIPFGDGTSSVGAVFDPSKAAIPERPSRLDTSGSSAARSGCASSGPRAAVSERSSESPTTPPRPRASAATGGSWSETRRASSTRCSRRASSSR